MECRMETQRGSATCLRSHSLGAVNPWEEESGRRIGVLKMGKRFRSSSREMHLELAFFQSFELISWCLVMRGERESRVPALQGHCLPRPSAGVCFGVSQELGIQQVGSWPLFP